MAVFTTIAFATFLLENDYFVAFYQRGSNFAYHLCAFYCGGTYFYGTVYIGKKNAVEFDAVAFFYIFTKVVNIQEPIFFGLELLTLDFYDYVHFVVL